MSRGTARVPIGRARELGQVGEFLDGLNDGPACLVLTGPPGIGKTTVWKAAVDEARRLGMTVLETRPTETDAGFSFAALADLFDGVEANVLEAVPEPQRDALDVALRRATPKGAAIDAFAVSLAVRAVLHLLSRSAPTIVAVDDLEWVDTSSTQALDFAFRRLPEEPVGLLATASRQPLSAGRLPEGFAEERARWVELEGLGADDLAEVLHSRLDTVLGRSAVLRLQHACDGNPMHALELARALARTDALPEPGGPIPVPDDLTTLLRARLEHLPAEVRQALEVAALASDPSVGLIERMEGAGEGLDARLAVAEEAGIVLVRSGGIRFTHPLLAHVLAADLPASEARLIHARLADLANEPEDRARHRALASTGPDEEVALDLEAAAADVRARGGSATAADLAEQAATSTPPGRPEDVRRRIIAAAEYHLDAGDPRRSRLLLEGLLADLPPGVIRAVVLQRLGWARYHEDSWVAAAPLFEQARGQAVEDASVEASIALDSALASLLTGDVGAAAALAEDVLGQAQALGDRALMAEASAVAGSIEFLSGRGAAESMLERGVELETWSRPRPTLKNPSVALGIVLKWSDDYDRARELLGRAYAKLKETGNERSMPFLLFHLAELECWIGEWTTALEHAGLGIRIAGATGQESGSAFCRYANALVLAHRGSLELAVSEVERALAEADRSGAVPAVSLLRSVLGFIAVSQGDFEGAWAHLGPLAEGVLAGGIAEPGVLRFLGDAVEAQIATGRVAEAEELVHALEARSEELDRPWGRAVAARYRGLLAAAAGDEPGAVRAFEAAEEHHRRLANPFEAARTQLSAGAALRRFRRRRAARDAIGAALEAFEALGASIWAERARSELSRIGGRVAASTALTPTEERIATLVASGEKNREIADVLFLSIKTVEWNLSQIYRKLGVRSRSELTRWIAANEPATSSPDDE